MADKLATYSGETSNKIFKYLERIESKLLKIVKKNTRRMISKSRKNSFLDILS